MTSFSFSSLRVRLTFLVLLAVIPALGLILYTAAEQRRSASVEAQQNALRLARSVSSSQDDLIEGARQLLISLAQMPFIQSDDPEICNSVLSKLVKEYKNYANLGVTSLAGDATCSGLPIPAGLNFADRSWFRGVTQTGGFFIGEYQVGRISRKAVLGLGYPVHDETGRLQAILYAGLDLDWLNSLAGKTELPPGTTLTVFDRQGTIIVRYPNPEKWVGQPVSSMPLVKTILAQGEGAAEAYGVDGLPRLYGFTPLGSRASGAYVTIGISKAVAIAPANRILTRNLTGLGIVSALAFLAAWFGADLFILRQVNALTSATKRLSEGDLSVRTGLSYGEGELGQLARTFDTMAASMEQLITERKRSEQRLASLHEINIAITSSLDLHAVLNVLMEKIDLFLPYTAVLVWLRNREDGGLERAACWNLNEEEWRGRKLTGTPALVEVAVGGKAPVVALNVQTDPRTLDPDFYRRHGLVSYLGVPLLVKDEVLGVLVFLTREEHPFTDEEIEFLSTLAGQAAVAIHNAQLHEQTKNQAAELDRANKDLEKREEIQTLLKELSQDIGSLDIDSLLKKLTEKVREVFKADVSDVRIFEGSGWSVMGVSGIDPTLVPSIRTGTSNRRSRWIAENRKPLVIPDTTREDRLPSGETIRTVGLRGYLGVPLFSRDGQVIGVLRALTHQPREFAQEQVDLLQQLANGAAVALENARLLEQTKRQAGELEKANKVKDEFLGFVSHELRTPVNALIGYAAMIQDKLLGEINPKQEKALEKIIARSRELLSMISSLLQATRIEAGAVKVESHEVALGNFLEELRLAFDVLPNKELSLIWDYPSDLPLVRTDGEKLRHILENLISNALKFTKKGSVKVSAQCLPEAGRVVFEVADTGIGIPKESLPAIFDMFHQINGSQNQSSGGVGLGLHIVKTFTEMLGGKIDVESEVGKGSTFTVTIPLERDDSSATAGVPVRGLIAGWRERNG